MIQIIDDLLHPYDWNAIYQKTMKKDRVSGQVIDAGILWLYATDVADGSDENSTGYFIHSLLAENLPHSDMFDLLAQPVVTSLKSKLGSYQELFRAKVNLFPRTHEIETHGFHHDIATGGIPVDHLNCVYYVNNNDGYTEFEDGTRIASVENRAVIFNGRIKHRSTSCTNEPCRVTINLNMLPRES